MTDTDTTTRDYAASMPSVPTTQGVPHWYLVCADDEQKAQLCGPFFDKHHSDDELRIVEQNIPNGDTGMCERKHFLTPGPAPIGRFRIAMPLIYSDFDQDARDWWEAWAYDPEGEWFQARQCEAAS